MLFDSHTHIQFPVYDADRDEVISRAIKAGVKMIAVGTQMESSAAAITLAGKYPQDIWATVGFHPGHALPAVALGVGGSGSWHYDKSEQAQPVRENFDITALRKLAAQPEVVAIGECGLDYFRIMNDELRIKGEQRTIFQAQIDLAKELHKPLMIHARASKGTDDAYEEVFSIIHNSSFIIPRIMHFYAGSLAMTKKFVNAGYYFTFGGVITFARDYDEIIKYIPLSQILLETDAPYVAPAPYRGKRNEPAYIIETAKKLAELKSTTFEEICQATTDNAKLIFNIEP